MLTILFIWAPREIWGNIPAPLEGRFIYTNILNLGNKRGAVSFKKLKYADNILKPVLLLN